jgi:hypothetical protein
VPHPRDVRPEYEALARDFAALAAPFDLAVDESLERDLVLVAASFETADRYVDTTPDEADRARLCAAVLVALHESGAGAPLPIELAATLAALRSRLVAIDVLDAFVGHLLRFFVRSEAMRQTVRDGEFVRCVLDEARCAAEMALLVVPAAGARRFSRFFCVLSEIANLVDKLHDVRGDWSRGEIAVRPGFFLHVRLLAAFAMRLPALLVLARRPCQLITWGARYVLPGWANRELRTSNSQVTSVRR